MRVLRGLTIDREEDLDEVPCIAQLSATLMQLVSVRLTERPALLLHRRVGHHSLSFCQQRSHGCRLKPMTARHGAGDGCCCAANEWWAARCCERCSVLGSWLSIACYLSRCSSLPVRNSTRRHGKQHGAGHARPLEQAVVEVLAQETAPNECVDSLVFAPLLPMLQRACNMFSCAERCWYCIVFIRRYLRTCDTRLT